MSNVFLIRVVGFVVVFAVDIALLRSQADREWRATRDFLHFTFLELLSTPA